MHLTILANIKVCVSNYGGSMLGQATGRGWRREELVALRKMHKCVVASFDIKVVHKDLFPHRWVMHALAVAVIA